MSLTQVSTKTNACPRCGSDAVYRYGRSNTGRQRFLCLMCGRQFVEGHPRPSTSARPRCPACGQTMHIYRQYGRFVRYRCADYPNCRTFLKVQTEEK